MFSYVIQTAECHMPLAGSSPVDLSSRHTLRESVCDFNHAKIHATSGVTHSYYAAICWMCVFFQEDHNVYTATETSDWATKAVR